jgi:hypothetical protein
LELLNLCGAAWVSPAFDLFSLPELAELLNLWRYLLCKQIPSCT